MSEEFTARFECLRQELLRRGLPDNEARTEVARIAVREVWDPESLVCRARRRLQFNGGLMERLHPHPNPAFDDADPTLQCLEVFLAGSHKEAA